MKSLQSFVFACGISCLSLAPAGAAPIIIDPGAAGTQTSIVFRTFGDLDGTPLNGGLLELDIRFADNKAVQAPIGMVAQIRFSILPVDSALQNFDLTPSLTEAFLYDHVGQQVAQLPSPELFISEFQGDPLNPDQQLIFSDVVGPSQPFRGWKSTFQLPVSLTGAVLSGGSIVYVSLNSNPDYQLRISETTGAASVPEPSSCALLVSGAFIGALGRRRRRPG